ncbi:hypothetical protein [Tsukamurella sp. NPDC003166]|uniref:hypothetical protein n=1 Tax=Tsukamurella sp. NPDC003166 TaxID=3154444 RepID=UPI0033A55E9A
MFVQYVEPRRERWSLLQETTPFTIDTCTALFVEARPSEAAAIVDRFDLHAESDDSNRGSFCIATTASGASPSSSRAI